MAMIGPVQPGAPYLPPSRDKKLARRRRDSYEQSAPGADVDVESSSADDDIEAALLARFPVGSGPISWIARLIFQTYHSVLRPKLGRIVDILA
jgi:hypothetical protein